MGGTAFLLNCSVETFGDAGKSPYTISAATTRFRHTVRFPRRTIPHTYKTPKRHSNTLSTRSQTKQMIGSNHRFAQNLKYTMYNSFNVNTQINYNKTIVLNIDGMIL